MAQATLSENGVNAQEDQTGSLDPQDIMRLGWMMAETLGRYRLGDQSQRVRPQVPVDRNGSVLPLSVERSPAEQRIEAEGVLIALAADQHLDCSLKDLNLGKPNKDTMASAHMVDVAIELSKARKENHTQVGTRLAELNELFYKWDSMIQDELAAGPYGRASAYQLGRGLAETYWALDENASPDAYASWNHLLVVRFNTLATLLRRCAGTLPKLVAETLTATLEQWRGVAERFDNPSAKRPPLSLKTSNVDRDDAVEVLRQQVGVWRDLLLSDSEPASVLATDQTWARARRLWPLVKSFWPELVALLVGLLLVGGAIAWVSVGGGVPKILGGTLAAVLGAFGVTTATVLARLKAAEQGLMSELQDKITADAVIAAATYLPDSYTGGRKSIRQAASAGSRRHLGPVVAYDHDRAANKPASPGLAPL